MSRREDKKIIAETLDGIWASACGTDDTVCWYVEDIISNSRILASDRLAAEEISTAYSADMFPCSVFAPDEALFCVSGRMQEDVGGVLDVYSDASRANETGAGGVGIFADDGECCAEYAAYLFDAAGRYAVQGNELAAAVYAIKLAIAHKYEKVRIHYDCAMVAVAFDDAVKMPNRTSSFFWLVEQYLDFIEIAKELIDIEIVKVKGHSSDWGNEHADYLACTARAKTAAKTKGITTTAAARKEKTKSEHEYETRSIFAKSEVFVVSNKNEEQARHLLSNTVRAYMRRNNIGDYREATCDDVSVAYCASNIAQSVGLDDDENKYVWLATAGAGSNKAAGRLMEMPATKISSIRKSVCKKLDVPDNTDPTLAIVGRVLEELYGAPYSSQSKARAAQKEAAKAAAAMRAMA